MRRFRAFIRRLPRLLFRSERGQSATEYMMVISVLVVAMVAASRPFVAKNGPFQQGMERLSRNIGGSVASSTSDLLPRR